MSWTLTRPNIRSQAHGSIKSMRFFYFRWKEENDAKANELSQGQATVFPGFTVLVCCRAPPAGRTASAFELSSATNIKIRDSGNDKFPESLAFSCSVQQGKRNEKRFQQKRCTSFQSFNPFTVPKNPLRPFWQFEPAKCPPPHKTAFLKPGATELYWLLTRARLYI